jgi:hypothetical protein
MGRPDVELVPPVVVFGTGQLHEPLGLGFVSGPTTFVALLGEIANLLVRQPLGKSLMTGLLGPRVP